MTNLGVETFFLYSMEYENTLIAKKFVNSLNSSRAITLIQCNENLSVIKEGIYIVPFLKLLL